METWSTCNHSEECSEGSLAPVHGLLPVWYFCPCPLAERGGIHWSFMPLTNSRSHPKKTKWEKILLLFWSWALHRVAPQSFCALGVNKRGTPQSPEGHSSALWGAEFRSAGWQPTEEAFTTQTSRTQSRIRLGKSAKSLIPQERELLNLKVKKKTELIRETAQRGGR